jgi:hemerythrin-like domain-containing protein
MSAIEDLKHEHRVIEKVLAILIQAADRADKGKSLSTDFFPKVVDFLRNFVDRCHHGKEEENLFVSMEKRGVSREGGPLGIMLIEHEQGRAFVKRMDEAGKRLADGDQKALKVATDSARAYSKLLQQHIKKEDDVLYPMADRVLTAADQKKLLVKFEEIELERIGPGKHEEYLKLIAKLESEMGLK